MESELETVERIEQILKERFSPQHLELVDESHRHVGHRGATSGGGHYQLLIVAEAFEGLGLLDQHRLVNEALDGLFGERIHALALRTYPPSRWEKRGG